MITKHGDAIIYLTDQRTELRLLNMVMVLKEVDMMKLEGVQLMLVHNSYVPLTVAQLMRLQCSARHDSADQTGADTAH